MSPVLNNVNALLMLPPIRPDGPVVPLPGLSHPGTEERKGGDKRDTARKPKPVTCKNETGTETK